MNKRELTPHFDTRFDRDPNAFCKITQLINESDLPPEDFRAWAPRLSENEVHKLYVESVMQKVNKAYYVEVNGKPVIMPGIYKIEFKIEFLVNDLESLTETGDYIVGVTKSGKTYLFKGEF